MPKELLSTIEANQNKTANRNTIVKKRKVIPYARFDNSGSVSVKI